MADVNLLFFESDSALSIKSLNSLDSSNALKLFVAVPLESLHPKGINGLDQLSVGFSLQRGMSGMSAGGQRPGGQSMSGSSGSGGRGGRGGGGGGGRGGGSSGSQGGGRPQGMSGGGGGPIAFWYVTTLSKR